MDNKARDILELIKSTVSGDNFDGSKIDCVNRHFLKHYNKLRCPFHSYIDIDPDELGDIIDDGGLTDASVDTITINFKSDDSCINKIKQLTLKYNEKNEKYEISSVDYYPFEELSTTRVEEENSFYDVCR